MAVRRRLMKAVFFFREESRELLTVKTSADHECESSREAGNVGEPFSPAQARAFKSRSSPGAHEVSSCIAKFFLSRWVVVTFPLAIHVDAILPYVTGSGGVKIANTARRRVKDLSCEQKGSRRRNDLSAA